MFSVRILICLILGNETLSLMNVYFHVVETRFFCAHATQPGLPQVQYQLIIPVPAAATVVCRSL
jgi:hypothetical protein